MTPRGVLVLADVQRIRRQDAALILARLRAVAAEVALVGPKRLVLIEVFARKDIDGQWLYALRRRVGGETIELLWLARRRPLKQPTLPSRAHDRPALNANGERPTAPDALEADVRHDLRDG